MQHLDDGLIHELLDGEVPSDRLPPIQAHLAGCAMCTALLEAEGEIVGEVDGMIESLDDEQVAGGASVPASAPNPVPVDPARRLATWPRQVAWAASLVLAVGLGYTARGGIDGPVLPGSDTSGLEAVAGQGGERPANPVSPETESAVPQGQSSGDGPQQVVPTPSAGERRQAGSPQQEAGGGRERIDAEPEAADSRGRAVPSLAIESNAFEDASITTGASSSEVGARGAPTRDQVARRAGLQAPAPAAAADAVREFSGRAVGARLAAAKAGDVAAAVTSEEGVGVPVGPLWVIGGMEPSTTELSGEEIRLRYLHPLGEVVLVQWRVGGGMGYHLEAPAGFPADTLMALTRRVR